MKNINNFINTQSYYLCFLVPLIAFFGLILDDIYVWLTPFFVFLLLPLLDQIWPLDKDSLATNEESENDFTLWILWFLVICLFYYAISMEIKNIFHYLGIITTVGILTGGVSGMVAHEFMHRKEKIYRITAQILLLYCLYPQFYTAHMHFHHPFVGTDKDPATARKNESIYHFIPRSIFNSFKMSWQFEQKRIQKKKR